VALDIGAAVGRFAFETSRKYDFVVGSTIPWPLSGRRGELMLRGRKAVALRQEGNLTREETLVLPTRADRQGRVHRRRCLGPALSIREFLRLASLNIADKVPLPAKTPPGG